MMGVDSISMGRGLRSIIAALCLGCMSVPMHAAADAPPGGLRQFADAQLQQLLERGLARLALQDAVRGRRLAVALVDISDIDHPRVAQVNGDHMMYAASLPKIGILLAACSEIQHGRLKMSAGIRQRMTDMIRVSSNEAATFVMNLVGRRRVNEILASEPYRLYDPATNGGLWVGKEYGKNPAFQRDPLHNISHGATAMQVARFYYLMESGHLLNEDMTREMKQALSRPGIRHKFVKGLSGRDAEVYRKSGTWREWHADSALVETSGGKYILVALAHDPDGGDWLARLAPVIHDSLLPIKVAARR
jgi:beta-lactamase class A